HAEVPEPPDESYPLVLTTGREPDGYNTGIRSRDEETDPAVAARVNPDTIEGLNDGDASDDGASVAPGEPARLASRRGSIAVRVTADAAVPTGTVWMPIHRGETNDLTLAATDPRSNEPNYKQCAVALAPAGDEVAAADPRRTTPTADD
ncbi:nitrate reductase, partial [Halorubrum sp. SS5]